MDTLSKRGTEEVIVTLGRYKAWVAVSYGPGLEPEILDLQFEPAIVAADLSFSCDIIVRENMTIESLIMEYLQFAKLDGCWIEEEIQQLW